MTAPLMPRATAVWLVENTTLTFRQISRFCELHELEIQAIADGDVSANIIGLSPIDSNQLTIEEIKRCEADTLTDLILNEMEKNVKLRAAKTKKILSPSQRSDKPAAILWVLKHYPELKDIQICRLIGTTKPTIESIRNGSYRDMLNLKPKNPVTIGLCSEKNIEAELITLEKRNAPKVKKEKKAKTPKAKKEKKVKATKVKKEKKAKEPKVKKKAVAKKKAPAKKAKKTARKK